MANYFGRILHFTLPNGRVYPAIVTRDYDEQSPSASEHVDLCVFAPNPEVWENVDIVGADEPRRGCAHPAQTAAGPWSTVRYVPDPSWTGVQSDSTGSTDTSSNPPQLQPAGEQPVEFAPELLGAGVPVADTVDEETSELEELPPSWPIRSTRRQTPPSTAATDEVLDINPSSIGGIPVSDDLGSTEVEIDDAGEGAPI